MGLNADSIRRLGSSQFNYWFGYVANISLVAWMASHGVAHGRPVMPWLSVLSEVAAGFLLWTFLEYVLHRYVYHVIPSFLSVGHDLHHQTPRELIGVPWYLTTIIVVVTFKIAAALTQPAAAGTVLAATWLGYVGYCLAHHASHHWRLPKGPLRRMKQHHLLHHAYPDYNWGFTTGLWDVVFHTAYPRNMATQQHSRRRRRAYLGAPTP